MTTANLNFGTDAQGRNAYAPNISNLIYRAILGQNSVSNITLPTETDISQYEVCFSYQPGSTVWVDCSGATATVPVNSSLAVSTSELLPGQRVVPAGNQISMITPDIAGAYVGVAIYAKTT